MSNLDLCEIYNAIALPEVHWLDSEDCGCDGDYYSDPPAIINIPLDAEEVYFQVLVKDLPEKPKTDSIVIMASGACPGPTIMDAVTIDPNKWVEVNPSNIRWKRGKLTWTIANDLGLRREGITDFRFRVAVRRAQCSSQYQPFKLSKAQAELISYFKGVLTVDEVRVHILDFGPIGGELGRQVLK